MPLKRDTLQDMELSFTGNEHKGVISHAGESSIVPSFAQIKVISQVPKRYHVLGLWYLKSTAQVPKRYPARPQGAQKVPHFRGMVPEKYQLFTQGT